MLGEENSRKKVKSPGEAKNSLPLGEGGRPQGRPDEGRDALSILCVGAAACPARSNSIRRNGGARSLPLQGKPFSVPSVSFSIFTALSTLAGGRGMPRPYRASPGVHRAPHPVPSGPLSSGMTATGSHGYFYSLRGAQPYTGEPLLRASNSLLLT